MRLGHGKEHRYINCVCVRVCVSLCMCVWVCVCLRMCRRVFECECECVCVRALGIWGRNLLDFSLRHPVFKKTSVYQII